MLKPTVISCNRRAGPRRGEGGEGGRPSCAKRLLYDGPGLTGGSLRTLKRDSGEDSFCLKDLPSGDSDRMSTATGAAGIKKVKKVTKSMKKGDGEASIETTTTTITTQSGTQDGNVRGTGGDFLNGR